MWGDKYLSREEYKLFATTGFTSNKIQIWSYRVEDSVISPHIRIGTSLDGIRFLIETTPRQLVGIDKERTVKFYEFVDKDKRDEEEKEMQREKEFNDTIRVIFNKYDVDQTGSIDYIEGMEFLMDLLEAISRHAGP